MRDHGLGAAGVEVDDDGVAAIARIANGDARAALNILEVAVAMVPVATGRKRIEETTICEAAQRRTLLYDKAGEEQPRVVFGRGGFVALPVVIGREADVAVAASAEGLVIAPGVPAAAPS